MADTVRTIAALQTLLADGQPAGSITPQIIRDMLVSLDPLNANVAWSRLTSVPTTVGGLGITDFNSLGDARWLKLAGGTMTGPLTQTNQATPSTPSAGTIARYSNTRNTRSLPYWIDPAGRSFAVQESLLDCVVRTATANATAAVSGNGIAVTIGGTSAVSTLATTNRITAVRRVTSSSISTAGNFGGFTTDKFLYAGAASGAPGGFDVNIICSHETDLAGSAFFAGLISQVSGSTISPGGAGNTVSKFGIGLDAADTNYQLIYNAGGGVPTKVDLGVARASGTHFIIELYSQPGIVGISWRVRNGTTLAVIGTPGTITTAIPTNTSVDFLSVHVTAANIVTGVAGVSLTRWIAVTDN